MSAGDVFPRAAKVKTIGEPVQNASLVSAFPPPNPDSAREAEETREGDMMSAKPCNDRDIMYSDKGEYDLPISGIGIGPLMMTV